MTDTGPKPPQRSLKVKPEGGSKGLKSLVNASGFLLQLAVEHHIAAHQGRYEWKILSREHPWRDAESQEEGFIDLVVGLGSYRLVIECKRSQNADWVFLVQARDEPAAARIRSRWVHKEKLAEHTSGWHDFNWLPVSFESEFCVVRGTGEASRPMLERHAAALLSSLDALAIEELGLTAQHDNHLRIYVPVIVTTARLSVCRFQIRDISLHDGKIQEAEFENVPIIRFRKSLSTIVNGEFSPEDLGSANRHKERTVLVINASSLTDVLVDLKPRKKSVYEEWPWLGEKLWGA
jgi:hypothetical protein